MTAYDHASLTVSIHAFRGEGDEGVDDLIRSVARVSIHAFRGEGDLVTTMRLLDDSEFQSTPSGGKATHLASDRTPHIRVSIHAFRGEGDTADLRQRDDQEVSIHAFRWEGDEGTGYRRHSVVVSIHAFRGEGDRGQALRSSR